VLIMSATGYYRKHRIPRKLIGGALATFGYKFSHDERVTIMFSSHMSECWRFDNGSVY